MVSEFSGSSSDEGETTVSWDLKNCGRAGLHGFHVHKKPFLTNGCKDAGGYFNPKQVDHGATDDSVRHVGDLPMIVVDENGNSVGSSKDTYALLDGEHSVVGLPIVIHNGQDDEGTSEKACSKRSGCAGPRIACGIITLVDDNEV